MASSKEDNRSRDERESTATSAANREAARQQQGSREGSGFGGAQQRQQQEAVSRSIDATKENIREAINEARQQMSKHTQVMNDYQNQTIDATKEMAESYLDAQRSMINSMQSNWNQSMMQQQMLWFNMSPQAVADAYTRMAGSFADASVAATRMANNLLSANLEAAKTTLNYAKDNAREMARLASNFAGSVERSSREQMQQQERRF
ncbi:hypothetical protein [Nitrososphaera sp.]|uniref:hypothetical protein n=1 Tax=Nitrososphaera sp. TaxID=1971748 RepID=UPI00307F6A20